MNPSLVEESLRHVCLEPRGEDLGGPEDGGGRPLVRLRDAEELLPVAVLRDHLEELGHLSAPVVWWQTVNLLLSSLL